MFLSHFPGAPAVLGLGKGWAEMRWLCAVLAFPIPWSKDWMESFTQSFQLSDAGENNRRSKPASVSNVTDKRVRKSWLTRLNLIIAILLIFSNPCLHTHTTHGEVRGQGHTLLPALAMHGGRSAAAQQFGRLSVPTWLPRKHPCSLSLNNSFLHYVPPQYPVSWEIH